MPKKAAAKRAILVIPCYNEERRLNARAFKSLADEDRIIDALFVDDGSKDETLSILKTLAKNWKLPAPLVMAKNGGKAEAVRQGLLAGIASGAEFVGYMDADRSVSPQEADRVLRKMAPQLDVLIGSRIKLLGYRIRRTLPRHYIGRVFATAASICLRLPIYDTQCGMKWFRVTDALKSALAEPFHSRWAFDIELIGRLHQDIHISKFEEVPLREWLEIPGSKVKPLDFPRALLDILRIRWALNRRLKARASASRR